MSHFKFYCPNCNQRIEASLKYVGTRSKCPTCKKSFVVPYPEAEPLEKKSDPDSSIIELYKKISSAKRNWVILAWASVLLSLSILYIIHNRVEWHLFRSAAITTSGTVTESSGGSISRDGGESAYSKYEFWVNGERFFGGSEKYISKGKSVMIAYLPNDPSRNDLADDKSGYKFGFWFAIVVCIFGTWMFHSGLKA